MCYVEDLLLGFQNFSKECMKNLVYLFRERFTRNTHWLDVSDKVKHKGGEGGDPHPLALYICGFSLRK